MAQFQLFLLPAIALAIVVFRNPFDRDVTLSNSWRSRRRRRVLLRRLTVVVLLLATVATEIWPLGNKGSLFQSVLMSALILVPAYALHWGILLVHANDSDRRSAKRWEDEKNKRQKNVAKDNNSERARPSVEQQLERMSELVDSHNLEDRPVDVLSQDGSADSGAQREHKNSRDSKVASNTAMIVGQDAQSDLTKLDTPQIRQLVTTLRKDKKRLQTLVIAQQAAIADERAAHDQTRVITKDAITVMRSARNAQKHAEKLARRERAERLRIEQQYKKVAYDLRNAMSIIKMRESAYGKATVES